MSRYIPYIIGQYPEIDDILIKVIINMGLELGEVSISKLEPSKYSGSNNIGIFLLNVEKSNNKYTGQWILKVEYFFEEPEYPDIQTINAVKSKYPAIQDIVVLPIMIGQVENLEYNVMSKAHGRSLYDIYKSHNSTLARPSFDEFDSYDSYVSEIEWRFEQDRTPMTTAEVKDVYFRFGKALGQLHNMGMDTSENNHLDFCTRLKHRDINDMNIYISAHSTQLIDNSDLVNGSVIFSSPKRDLVDALLNLIERSASEGKITSDLFDVIGEYFVQFLQGYINSFENKIICAKYLKKFFLEKDLCNMYGDCIVSQDYNKEFLNLLSSAIDSIIAEEMGNNNCEAGNLLGCISEEIILSE